MITGCAGGTLSTRGVAGTALSRGEGRLLLILSLVAVAAVMVTVGLLSTRVLRRLTPPASAEPAVYAALGHHRFAAGSATLCGAAALVTVASVRPWPLWLPWLTFCAVGVWVACVDALTGLVPRSAAAAAAAAMAAAAVAMGAAGAPWSWSLRAVVGGAVCWGFFVALWLVSRGALGFGDVRFALPLGIAAASASWLHLVAAVGGGAVIALAFGIAVRVLTGRRTFAYTPGLAAGLVVAGALSPLLRSG